MYFFERFVALCVLLTVADHCASEDVNLKTLRQVQVVYRHGARAPMGGYPNDPYKDKELYWPDGPGQLTERGKDQQYQLGEFFRSRYNGFLDSEYKMKEIHVLSSDTDRTLMSAEANLAGLYPRKPALTESGGDGISQRRATGSKLDIQLVPIHVKPKSIDNLLNQGVFCPRLEIAVDEYTRSSKELARLVEENKELLDFIAEKAGISKSGIEVVLSIRDSLYAEQQHGMQLPSWVNSTVLDKIREIGGYHFMITNGGTTEIRRLKGGPLAKQMVANMQSIQTASKNSYKFHMYSAHDNTIASVMDTIGVFDPVAPGFASAFMVELHQDESSGQYFVNLYYRNSTTEPPTELQVPGCGSPCFLDEFVEILEPVLPDNWEKECFRFGSSLKTGSSAVNGTVNNAGFAALIAFVGLVACAIIVWLSILVVKTKRERKQDSERQGLLKP